MPFSYSMHASEWPLFFHDQLIVGDSESPVAICTLWSLKESVADKIDSGSYSLIGNLYTADGINYIIRNVLANPVIRHIVLVGADLMRAGEALIELVGEGVGEDYRTKKTNAFIHRAIGKEELDLFRKNVAIHDLRKENAEGLGPLVSELNKTAKRERFCEPKAITAVEAPAEGLDTEDAVFRISGRSPSEVWLKALDTVMKFGEVKRTEYEIEQKELLDLVSVVEGDERALPAWLPINERDLHAYINGFFSASKPENVDYTYGERLFSYALPEGGQRSENELHGIINQIQLVEEKLRRNPYTRRAVAITWRHQKDFSSDNPPCLIEIVWSVKHNKLYQTATFRSHDIYGAWLLNIYGLRKLQKKMAMNIGVDTGSLMVVSVSAHIYKNNWKYASELIGRLYSGKRELVEVDKRGYFLVQVDAAKGEIVVKHKLNDARDSKYQFRGRRAEEIYRKIIHENLISRLDHAAYIGKELARAEAALKSGETFVQDAA